MVGVIGTYGRRETVEEMADAMYWEDWYELVADECGEFAVGMVTHGGKDANAHVVRKTENRIGLLFGVISNRPQLGWSLEETFDRVLETPRGTLPNLEGPFLIAVVDRERDRAVVATDKIGSRPCYYSTSDGFSFCSDLAGVRATLSNPTLNERAVSDLLLLNSVWGEKTLVTGVRSIPAAHFLEFEAGEVDVRRYWRFEYGSEKGHSYVEDLERAYRRAMGAVAETVEPPAGLWLSGGLDSRLMAGTLQETIDEFETYTYERPLEIDKWIGPTDVDLAPEVADALGVPNANVTLDPDRFVDLLPRCVDLVDGMLPWSSFCNLMAAFELPSDELNVLFEGSGHSELLGEAMWAYHLDRSNYASPVDSLLQRHGQLSPERARDLLSDDVDPRRTLEQEVSKSPEIQFEDIVRDVNNRNLFINKQFLSNKVMRSQAGTRLPLANGDLLDRIGCLHPDYCQGTVPFTGGEIPVGFTDIKLELLRTVGGGLEEIPYDRTGFAPARPAAFHASGYVTQQVLNRLVGTRAVEQWFLENDRLRSLLQDLLQAAADRPLWNTSAVLDLERSMSGENVHTIATITTIELWAQRHLDERAPRDAVRRPSQSVVSSRTESI